MQVRDLFILVIKLVVLVLLIDVVFSTIPFVAIEIATTHSILETNKANGVTLLISLVLLILLFRYAGKLVDWLKIEQCFSNPVLPLQHITLSMLAQLGIFFVGLSLFIHHLPSFLSNTWFWFKATATENRYEYVQTGNYWFISVFNLVLGYLLVFNAHRIARWMLKNQE